MKIDSIETGLYRVPLPEPLKISTLAAFSAFDMITARVRDSDGGEGWGYTLVHAGHGGAVAAMLEGTFSELALGEDPRRIEGLWQRLWRAHHYSGRGGPVSFAIAALDTALWDLRGRALGEPLWRLLGGCKPEVRAYAGNIDLHLDSAEQIAKAEKSLAAGFTAIKTRLGRTSLNEDIARIAALRAHIGPDIELMADANEGWRVDQAMRAFQALKDFALVWIEEPIAPDNFAGHAHLRAHGGIPIAAGENLHTLAEFAALIVAGGVDFPEPDLTTCGGITPWMKVARLAEAHGLPVTSHGAHEIHVQLLAAVPNAAYLEVHAVGLERFIAEPLRVEDGIAIAADRPGHGIDIDWNALAPHRVG